jgi:hypothetical protein
MPLAVAFVSVEHGILVNNGSTHVIKAMGNTKWGDVEIRPSTR